MTDEPGRVRSFLLAFGPGILFAATAVGVSHLVQSTRAGAVYGFSLVWVVLLANFFKYPASSSPASRSSTSSLAFAEGRQRATRTGISRMPGRKGTSTSGIPIEPSSRWWFS